MKYKDLPVPCLIIAKRKPVRATRGIWLIYRAHDENLYYLLLTNKTCTPEDGPRKIGADDTFNVTDHYVVLNIEEIAQITDKVD